MNGWKPVNWVRVLHMGHPPFLFKHILMHYLVGSVQSHAGGVLSRWGKIINPPQSWWLGSLYGWVGVFCIKVNDDLSSNNLTQRDAYPFHTPVVLLPCSTALSRHGGHPVHHPMVSVGWHLSFHQMHVILSTTLLMKTSTPTTHGLGASPIFGGWSGWHPWEKP